MFGRISRGWELTKLSYGFFRKNTELVYLQLIAIVSYIVLLVILGVAGVLIYGLLAENPVTTSYRFENLYQQDQSTIGTVFGFAVTFLALFVFTFIGVFFSLATVKFIESKLNNQPVTTSSALSYATSKLGRVFGLALIFSTVGIVLSLLSSAFRDNKNPFLRIIGSLFTGILSISWNLINFLTIPVMVVENKGPIDSIKQSGNLLKKTWGENITGSVGISLIFSIVAILMFVIFGGLIIALTLTGPLLSLIIIIIAIVSFAILFTITYLLSTIFKVILYRYAIGETLPQGFDEEKLRTAFTPKKAAKPVAAV